MNSFKSEARHLMRMKNLLNVCLGCILVLGAVSAHCEDDKRAIARQKQEQNYREIQEAIAKMRAAAMKDPNYRDPRTIPQKAASTTSK